MPFRVKKIVYYVSGRSPILTSGSAWSRASESGVNLTNPSLTSGSGLNQAQSYAPYPANVDAGYKLQVAFKANSFRDVATVRTPANYGSVTSDSNFQFKSHEYAGVGNYATDLPRTPGRPTYNNLEPVTYGLMVQAPSTQAQPGELALIQSLPNSAVEYNVTGTASLFAPEPIGG